METKDALLSLLEQNRGTYFSGGEIARRLSVSRTSVWKAVNRLRRRAMSSAPYPTGDTALLTAQIFSLPRAYRNIWNLSVSGWNCMFCRRQAPPTPCCGKSRTGSRGGLHRHCRIPDCRPGTAGTAFLFSLLHRRLFKPAAASGAAGSLGSGKDHNPGGGGRLRGH